MMASERVIREKPTFIFFSVCVLEFSVGAFLPEQPIKETSKLINTKITTPLQMFFITYSS
jgi:hypothetical protein